METESKECGAWSEDAVRILIDSYTSKFVELQRSNLRQKDWQDILSRLSSSCGQGYSYARCRNKLDALKKKFKLVRAKQGSGSGGEIPKWKWYDHMEKLMDRSSGSGGARGIPGGIASGEKIGSLEDPSGDDGEVSSGDDGQEMEEEDEEQEEEEQEEEATGEVNEMPSIPSSSKFLFDMRQGGSGGFLGGGGADGGLNLTLSGICAAAGSSEFIPKVSERTIRKRKASSQAWDGQVKEVVAMVIQAVERIEKNRLEFEEKKLEMMREIDLKRNETNLEIAKCIADSCMSKSFGF